MSKQYQDRIIAIREMLASPLEHVVRNGLDFLADLMQAYSKDPDFIKDVRAIADDFPILAARIDAMISNSPNSEFIKKSPESPIKKNTLEETKSRSPKIFISYSHVDEKHMKRLISMLKPYESQKIFEIWHDREIIAGDEWYQDIQTAINSCNIALLLISIDFLNSRFIQDDELPRLLELRKQKGLRIIPIIIRDCPWKSVPVLKDLQAMPKDGEPIVSFKRTGQADHIWTAISWEIAELSKKI